MKLPNISTLILANFLFMVGFSMMHGTFILFTAMDTENGGLGFMRCKMDGYLLLLVC